MVMGGVPWGLKGCGTGSWGRSPRESLKVAKGSGHAPHISPPVQPCTLLSLRRVLTQLPPSNVES